MTGKWVNGIARRCKLHWVTLGGDTTNSQKFWNLAVFQRHNHAWFHGECNYQTTLKYLYFIKHWGEKNSRGGQWCIIWGTPLPTSWEEVHYELTCWPPVPSDTNPSDSTAVGSHKKLEFFFQGSRMLWRLYIGSHLPSAVSRKENAEDGSFKGMPQEQLLFIIA